MGNDVTIAIPLYRAEKYIKGTRAKLAFVSTNSISQGLSIEILY